MAGATDASGTPLDVRTHGVDIDPSLEGYVRDRAGRKLGKFAIHVQRVTVRFEDVNGPKGGEDIDCKIQVVIGGGPSLVVTETAAYPRDAFDFAIAAAEKALKHDLDRRGWSAHDAAHRRGQPRAAERRIGRPSRAPSRRAGGASTGERNRALSAPKAVHAYEDSRTDRPSRKSTRKSANHQKRDDPQRISKVSAVHSPKSRAAASRPRAPRAH